MPLSYQRADAPQGKPSVPGADEMARIGPAPDNLGQLRATWLILRAWHSGNDGEGQRRISIAGNGLLAFGRHDPVQQVHRRRMAGRVMLIRRPRQLRVKDSVLMRCNPRPYLCRNLMAGALGVR